jgi:hypothetical protein
VTSVRPTYRLPLDGLPLMSPAERSGFGLATRFKSRLMVDEAGNLIEDELNESAPEVVLAPKLA